MLIEICVSSKSNTQDVNRVIIVYFFIIYTKRGDNKLPCLYL